MTNTKHIISILLGICLTLVFYSCEELFHEEVPSGSPISIFDQAWNFADQEYSFFEYKNINWDSVYQEFRPLVNDNMTDEELFAVIGDMLYLLRDGHVNLSSKFDRSRNWEWYLGHPENFNYSLLERNYFKGEEMFVGSLIVKDFEDVGYFRYSSFSNGVTTENLDYVINKFANHKGIIIDVRNNGGGLLSNATKIAKRFAPEKTLGTRYYYKSGPQHEEFEGPYTTYITPSEELSRYTKPVIVLTNRHSYSATSFFAQYMRELENVILVGDWTGGGGGAPSYTELSNGWEIRVSSTRTEDPRGFNIENGVPVDVKIDMSKQDADAGKDSILEEALRLLRA